MNNPALRCHVCTSARLVQKPFGYQFNGKWLGGVACKECGVMFIEPQPSGEELKQLYSHEYFEGDFRCGHAGSYFDERAVTALFDRSRVDRIKALKPSGKLLEIGCAGGAFLHMARQEGFEVQGVELSAEMAQFAREKFGLEVFAGELEDARFPSHAFDVVYMADVLEHVRRPIHVLKEIHRITKENGLLAVVVPSQTNTLLSRLGLMLYTLLGKKVTVNLPPYHLFEYRPKSLSRMLQSCGFKTVKLTQSMIPPKEVALRGSKLQNIAKKSFQYPNCLMTRTLGILGDRVEAMAIKQSSVPPGTPGVHSQRER